MTPRPAPKNLITSLTEKQVRKMMEAQAKKAFGLPAAEVLSRVRTGALPKNAAATNISMLNSLIVD
jgi:hypothetical protein